MVSQIYPTELQLNKENAFDTEAPFLDLDMSITNGIVSSKIKYRLFNVLCWLWNIYEGAELPSVYFIANTKHCITYLALTQLFPVLVSHPEMYSLCSILLHFV